jgi:MoxR-like ATPase
LGYEFGFLSLTSGTTEGMMYGKMSSTGKYLPADLVRLVEGQVAKGKKGAVFLLDEVDGADPNTLLMLNALLANGRMSVPNRTDKPYAQRVPNFILVAAANTWGTGADFQYVGRNQLDAAFLSRFAGAVLEVTYDETVERSLTTEEWYLSFLHVRQSAVANRIERVLGTRELIAGQMLLKAGYSMKETWAALTPGWSSDEIRLSGVQL